MAVLPDIIEDQLCKICSLGWHNFMFFIFHEIGAVYKMFLKISQVVYVSTVCTLCSCL